MSLSDQILPNVCTGEAACVITDWLYFYRIWHHVSCSLDDINSLTWLDVEVDHCCVYYA